MTLKTFQNVPMWLNDHQTLIQKVVGEACFPLFIGSSPFHMDEGPSSAHHHQEADSASELQQRSFASGANHSLRTPGNHVNCQISILGNNSKNSTWVVLSSPLWQAGGGWMIGRWRRTADTRGQLTAGGNRDCENRRLSSALPFFPACLPFDCLMETTDKQQN